MGTKVFKENNGSSGIDFFRIIAVILVVMIHTYPLAGISEGADFILTRIIGRIAVPFFFMVTGYFVLPSIMREEKKYNVLIRNVKKLLKLYIVAVLLYLPINIYSGKIETGIDITGILKEILFNGTFYHLWYLSAAIIGIVIVALLLKKFKLKHVLAITIGLYVIGLFGDSYYGIIEQVPAIKAFYNGIYTFCDYTRNGIFFAPVFFVLAAIITKQEKRPKANLMVYGFIISLALMIVEGVVLYKLQVQRHSSMYILLLPVMYFLFQWILSWNTRSYKKFRNVNMIVYIIHPLVIILVRGIFGVINLESILVDNNLIHFIVVLCSSFALAIIINIVLGKSKQFLSTKFSNDKLNK